MLVQPIHIVTRGHLDGEYGIATRGYLPLPDIIPRFPNRAEVEVYEGPPVPALVEELSFSATMEDHPVFTLQAVVAELAEPTAAVSEIPEPTALVADAGLDGVVEVVELMVGDVQEPGLQVDVDARSDVGVLDVGEVGGSVVDQGPLGDVDEDEPPGC